MSRYYFLRKLYREAVAVLRREKEEKGMTLREFAHTLPCTKCGAKPGEMCKGLAGRSKGGKFFVHHKIRFDLAKALQPAASVKISH